MDNWIAGYTRAELDQAQERYRVNFPPDLIALFLERRPARGYAWHTKDSRIREMFDWPLRMLTFDVEHGFWWPEWGDRTSVADERREIIKSFLATKSRLIPVYSHRFLPEMPGTAGNPVFSMHGFDTIYYGSNLAEYFLHEFERPHETRYVTGEVRHIPFWSDIIDHTIACAYYKASDNYQRMLADQEGIRNNRSKAP